MQLIHENNVFHSADDANEDDDFSVSTLLERANINLGKLISSAAALFLCLIHISC